MPSDDDLRRTFTDAAASPGGGQDPDVLYTAVAGRGRAATRRRAARGALASLTAVAAIVAFLAVVPGLPGLGNQQRDELVAPAQASSPSATPSSASSASPVNPKPTTVACVDDPSADDQAVPTVEGQVLVFFACSDYGTGTTGAEVGKGHARTVQANDVQGRLAHAFAQLALGPNASEERAGYGWAMGPDELVAPTSVTLTGGLLTVDFPAPIQTTGVESGRIFATLYALRSTAFQAAEVEAVRFTAAGDCALFWNLFEGSCHLVKRGDAP